MNKLNVIITGSTGMVGKSVLQECLINSNVESVLIINRKAIGLKHEKLKEITVDNFFNLSGIKEEFKGYNACFFCLGVSSSVVSKEEYKKITYDMTMHFAEIISEMNDDLTFCYVSGVGTNSEENSRMEWANVKGKVENDLSALQNMKTYLIRLGMLFPAKGIKSRTKSFNVMYIVLRPLLYLYKLISPKGIVSSENFGKALINTALYGHEKKRLWNKDLNKLALK